MKQNVRILTVLFIGIFSTAASGIGLIVPEGSTLTPKRQYVWIHWDPTEQLQTLIVEPTFSTDATKVGVIVPTPSRPDWLEIDQQFFVGLTIFTRLDPLPDFVHGPYRRVERRPKYPRNADLNDILPIEIASVEEPLTIPANDTSALIAWFEDNGFPYALRENALQAYTGKEKWFLTLFSVDVSCLPSDEAGRRSGAIAPIGLTFRAPSPGYPARLDPSNADEPIEFRFFAHTPAKIDLAEPVSYAHDWIKLLNRAKKTYKTKKQLFPPQMRRTIEAYDRHRAEYAQRVRQNARSGHAPAQLLFGKQLLKVDITNLSLGRLPTRDLPKGSNAMIKSFAPHLLDTYYLTVIAKVFTSDELHIDLPFWVMDHGHVTDYSNHTFVLPTEKPFRGND